MIWLSDVLSSICTLTPFPPFPRSVVEADVPGAGVCRLALAGGGAACLATTPRIKAGQEVAQNFQM
jgi:hypothetical protein